MARRVKTPNLSSNLDKVMGSVTIRDLKRLGFDGVAKRLQVSPESLVEWWTMRSDAVKAEHLLHLQNIVSVPFPLFEKLPAARARVGSDNLLRLKWLLAFVQRKDKDTSDLAIEVFAFAVPSDEPTHEPYPPNQSFLELVPQKINDLAKQVRTGINALHAGREWETPPLSVAFVGSDDCRYYRGNAADCFLAAAVDLVVAERARIRKCDWPECKRLFVKNKRAKYCSQQCSAKERFSQWREKHFKSDPTAFSLWRHERYKASHPRAKMRPSNKLTT